MAAIAATFATAALPYVISGVAKVAGDHTTWNALQNTHDGTISAAGDIAEKAFKWTNNETICHFARFTGQFFGKIAAPSVTLSDDSMKTAKQAGDVVKQGVEMIGNAAIQHDPSKGWKWTAVKVAAGVGMVGAGVGFGAVAPEIVLGLTAQAGLAYVGNYFMSGKKAAEPKKDVLTETEIEAKIKKIEELKKKIAEFEARPEVIAYKEKQIDDKPDLSAYQKPKVKNKSVDNMMKDFYMIDANVVPAA